MVCRFVRSFGKRSLSWGGGVGCSVLRVVELEYGWGVGRRDVVLDVEDLGWWS